MDKIIQDSLLEIFIMIDVRISLTDNNIQHKFEFNEICSISSQYNLYKKIYREIPDEFLKLKTKSPHEAKSSCKLMDYLSIFDKIQICTDCILDYIYYFTYDSGEILPYVRKVTEEPIGDIEEFFKKYPEFLEAKHDWYDIGGTIESKRIYLNYLNFEKTINGYFQFGLFCISITEFYRFGHNCYKSIGLLLTKKDIEAYSKINMEFFNDEELRKLRNIDPSPTIEIRKGLGKIGYLRYTPRTGCVGWVYVYIFWPNLFVTMKSGGIIATSNKRAGMLF